MKSKSELGRMAILALLLALCAGPARAADADQARATMEKTVADVLLILGDASLPLQTKKDRIQAIAYERFDFVTMSKLVLKRDWKRFDPAQQQEFVEEFKEHLSARYGENLGRYENETAWELVNQLDRTPVDDTEALQAVYSELQRIQLADLPAIPLWYNGAWSQMSSQVWTNWPSDAGNHFLPVTWNGYWQLGGIRLLDALEHPAAAA